MDGHINKLLILFLFFTLGSCQNLKHTNEKTEIYISIKNNVRYNTDVIDYYIVNKTGNDIKILCNPNFFKRKKDSLFVNSWFNPLIEIYNDKKIIEPVLFKVNYSSKVLDSLEKTKEEYTEVNNLNNVDSVKLNILKNYVKTIKKNDSVKFSTKINFETEPRFYDFSENEGYILKKNKNYTLEMCINEKVNPNIISFLKKQNIFTQKICSNKVKLIFIKTNYSD